MDSKEKNINNTPKDNLVTCARCGGNATYEYKAENYTMYSCFGCGFTTTTFWKDSNPNYLELEKTIPELYKKLKWTDNNGNHWFPQTINIKDKGMVFADGVDDKTWKWSAIKAIPLNKREKYKFPPNQTHKMDMSSKKEFDQLDFMDALESIDYFKNN